MLNLLFQNFAYGCTERTFFSIPTWYKYLQHEFDPVTGLCNVEFSLMRDGVFNGEGIALLLLGIIDILVRIAALIAVGFVIYGGFKYITSQGSPEATAAALSTILHALIGLGVAVFATAIVFFVGTSLGGASGTGAGGGTPPPSCEGGGPC